MKLVRYCYSDQHTLGRLYVGDDVFHTMERPYRPGAPGGLPFVSCVPDGTYTLQRHERPNGDNVFALRNAERGVFYRHADVPDTGGRYLILFHAGNYVDDVQGCIAPGLGEATVDGRQMVTSSRVALHKIMGHCAELRIKKMTIRPLNGTKELDQ